MTREYPVFSPGYAPSLPEQSKLPDLSETIRELSRNLEQDQASGYTGQSSGRGINLTKSKGKYRIAKGIGKALKHSIAGYSQDELNERIVKGLRTQFNQDNTELAIDQAFVIRQSKQPDANRPELYELYETGEIDQALEMMGKRWVIGRPKR